LRSGSQGASSWQSIAYRRLECAISVADDYQHFVVAGRCHVHLAVAIEVSRGDTRRAAGHRYVHGRLKRAVAITQQNGEVV